MIFKVAHVNSTINSGGGPAGYLYHLSQAESFENNQFLDILVMTTQPQNSYIAKNFFKKIKEKLKFLSYKAPFFLQYFLLVLKIKMLWSPKINENFVYKLQQYPVLIFHNHGLAFRYLKKHRLPYQKIYMMSHSPTDFTTEYIEGIINELHINPVKKEFLIKRFSVYEQTLYNSVDGLIVPAIESLEGYFLYDSSYEIQSRVVDTLWSGVKALIPTHTREDMLNIFGLKSHIIIGYFGRYHMHKGFDLFLDIVNLVKNKCFYFISAGNGTIVPKLSITNYMNLGWRNDIANILEMVDVVIIPNRYSYFDLILLEALSLGKIIITSHTGGHKELINFSSGIVNFQNIHEIPHILERIVCEFNIMQQENLTLYNKYFTAEEFFSRHVILAKKLLGIKP